MREPTVFDLGDETYRAQPMNVLLQAKLGKRLLPILANLKALAGALQVAMTASSAGASDEAKAAVKESNDVFLDFAKALQTLPDADCDFIISECMAGVARRDENGGWAKVWNRQAAQPMFDDLNLTKTLNVVFAVLQAEFAGLF